MFVNPSTPTSISVAGVSKIETETKLIPWIIDEKPTFVKDVYSVTYICTRNASTTVVNFPMITVENEKKDISSQFTSEKQVAELRWLGIRVL